MPDFNALLEFQRLAAGRPVTLDRVPNVGDFLELEIPPRIYARDVIVRLIGAGGGVVHYRDCVVGDDSNVKPNRPGETYARSGQFLDHLGSGGRQRTHAGHLAELGFVDFVVPAYQPHQRLAAGIENHGLDQVARRALEELTDLLDG